MIVFDTEGTDLIKPEVCPIAEQPYLVEFAGIKLEDRSLKEMERLNFVCRPPIKLPEQFTKITGITEEMVADKNPYLYHHNQLADFFVGERVMVAHNLGYDRDVLYYTLVREGKVTNFPWPPLHLCTVEASQGIKGHRLSLSDLLLMAQGKAPEERIAFVKGQFAFHKSLGKCTVIEVQKDKLKVEIFKTKAVKTLAQKMFTKRAAFEGAHGAMEDTERLLTIVRWLRKEGHL